MYQQELKLAGVETVLFDKIMANPLKSTVMEGAACAKETGCDFIVALGGGSVMVICGIILPEEPENPWR